MKEGAALFAALGSFPSTLLFFVLFVSFVMKEIN